MTESSHEIWKINTTVEFRYSEFGKSEIHIPKILPSPEKFTFKNA